MLKYQKYILWCVFFSLCLWMLALLNFIFIYRAGEYGKVADLVQEQLQKGAIYGSATYPNNYLYKLELARRTRPEIIGLGSSRLMTMRRECFSRPFLNCGMGMLYLNQARLFLEELFQFHVPKIIILGADFWWFNDNVPQPDSFPEDHEEANTHLFDKIQLPVYWGLEGKVSIGKYFKVLINGDDSNGLSHYRNIGMSAIATSDGFRPDGSYVQSAFIFGRKEIYDPQFTWTLGLLSRPDVRFVYGRHLSEQRRQQFLEIVRLCRQYQVTLVVYIPPLAHRVCERMAGMKQEYGYIDEFRDFISTLPLETYDFHDPRTAGINDCEFIDGLHVGEVGSLKLLLEILRQNPESVLRQCLNVRLMQEKIEEFDNCVLSQYGPSMYNSEEVDFLGLGCKKNHPRPWMAGRGDLHSGP